mmetsp:Transcript_25620/g.42135  ORF Transcript_25620/g.42135 Transcript_25620/m.42135 type:complete len:468 (-) Transcript_25620:122-1525(-)|eukprot:CAMPEP_0184653398 /NCGR_PEP_ID=MMETSP0308-20130426/11117_1 /TAXON_ID=38269 /ORGANISM="Gloeochaete witrockiana, Strain SAG 46.84" /LENGTH=467 /DNA_ID=CAMNT_0027088831 /DNA_START=54 /DNA_END=1457 /DNA_ORIENTATION=+
MNGKNSQKASKNPVKQVHIVESLQQCEDFCRIIESATKNGAIVVDCEGVSLSREGELCLIQIFVETGLVVLFDICSLGPSAFDCDLRQLLEGPIWKIMHDCRQDSDALFHQFGVRLQHVFDTQVAHAVLVEGNGKESPWPISLARLLQKFAKIEHEAKDEVRKMMRADPSFWRHRPLTPLMIEYAVLDVAFLLRVRTWLLKVLTPSQIEEVHIRSAGYVDEYVLDPEGAARETFLFRIVSRCNKDEVWPSYKEMKKQLKEEREILLRQHLLVDPLQNLTPEAPIDHHSIHTSGELSYYDIPFLQPNDDHGAMLPSPPPPESINSFSSNRSSDLAVVGPPEFTPEFVTGHYLEFSRYTGVPIPHQQHPLVDHPSLHASDELSYDDIPFLKTNDDDHRPMLPSPPLPESINNFSSNRSSDLAPGVAPPEFAPEFVTGHLEYSRIPKGDNNPFLNFRFDMGPLNEALRTI